MRCVHTARGPRPTLLCSARLGGLLRRAGRDPGAGQGGDECGCRRLAVFLAALGADTQSLLAPQSKDKSDDAAFVERASELKEEGNKQYSNREFKQALATWEQARGRRGRGG
jgi:hypothetical protein